MHSSKKDPVILYFIAGSMPNSYEMAEIFMLGSNVRVRNGTIAEHTAPGAVETCDGVSGTTVPEAYRNKPDGEEVLFEMRKRIIEELRAQEQGNEQPLQQQQSEAGDKLNAEADAREIAAKTTGVKPKANSNAATAWVAQK